MDAMDNTTNNEPAPGPWTTIPELPCDFYQQIPDGITYLGECYGDDAEANAAHIVRCVNSHAALLEAAERVIEHRIHDYLDNTSSPYCELIDAIGQAYEGKEPQP